MHPDNIYQKAYDMELLTKVLPKLSAYVFTNKYGQSTVDFSNPEAVRYLNQALLKAYHQINYWEFPIDNLTPPVPGRADYLYHINDLIGKPQKPIQILDIGTGASLIYPLLGQSLFGWHFTATDSQQESLQIAQKIIDKNQLAGKIKLKWQPESGKILQNIIAPGDAFAASICNPPFYPSQKAAENANRRKNKNLKLPQQRNFKGQANELWTKGGELLFLKKYIKESALFKNQIQWFTGLISDKNNIPKLQKLLQRLNAKEVQIIPLQQGQKKIHILAWRF